VPDIRLPIQHGNDYMIKDMSSYFTAEKQESLLFIAVGLVAIAVAVWLWTGDHRLKSMAFPLIAVVAIQITVGTGVYVRTDGQVTQLSAQLETAPAELKASETLRMGVVMDKFGTYKIIEIALLVLGIGLILMLRNSDLAVGIGAGLLLQSAFMLCLDMFAEIRAEDYLKSLAAL
jgi:hypothetical protein